MSTYPDEHPVLIKLYIDYRDSSVDNYPQIEVCDECAELNGDIEEQDDLQPGEAAWCVECGLGNAAAAGDC